MKVLILNGEEVVKLLPMDECIEVMEKTLKVLSNGEIVQPLRTAMPIPGGNILGMMPSYINDSKTLGVKAITVFPGNRGTGYDSHQGIILLYEAEHGSLRSLVDATAITAIRTAAVSAVATKYLAKPDAGDLAILGTGTQSRTHLKAILKVRKIHRVRVWSLHYDRARDFAALESEQCGIKIEAIETAKDAVNGADIICTVTSSKSPVLSGEWLSKGVHINAVGACSSNARELDTSAVVKSRLFVDWKESTVNEAGDYLIPKSEGAIDENHILGNIGDVILGKVKGRQTYEDSTLFKSLGLSVEDIAASQHIYNKARDKGLGTEVEIGEKHH